MVVVGGVRKRPICNLFAQKQRKRKGAALPMCSPSHTEARAKLDVCPFAVKLPIKQTESVRLCTTKKTKKTKAFSLPPMINLGWGRRILFNSYLLCTVTSPFHTPSTHTHTHTFPFSPSSSPPPFVFNEVPACVQRWSDLFAHGGAPGPHGARVPRGAHSQATWPARGCAGMRIVAEPLRSCTRTVQPGAKTTSSSVRGKALHLPPLQTVASKQRTTQTKKVHIDIHTHILATTIDCVRTHHR